MLGIWYLMQLQQYFLAAKKNMLSQQIFQQDVFGHYSGPSTRESGI